MKTMSDLDANAMFAVPRVTAPTSGLLQGSGLPAAGFAARYRIGRPTAEPDSAWQVLLV